MILVQFAHLKIIKDILVYHSRNEPYKNTHLTASTHPIQMIISLKKSMTNHSSAYLNIALMLVINRHLRRIMTFGVLLLRIKLARIFIGKMLTRLRLTGCSKTQTIIAKFGESLTPMFYLLAG